MYEYSVNACKFIELVDLSNTHALYSIPVTTKYFLENRSTISILPTFDNGNDFTSKVMDFR